MDFLHRKTGGAYFMATPSMVWLDPRSDMPAWLYSGIGHVAAEWSCLEWELEETIRVLLEADVKRARIMTIGMNTRSRLACIQNLMQMHKAVVGDYKKLRNRIEHHIESDRNKVVHALWGKIGTTWYIIRTSGNRGDGDPKLSRAVLPERIPISARSLSEIASQTRKAAQEIVAIRAQIASVLAPSPHKSPLQLSNHYRRLARNNKAPSRLPRPSPA